MMCIRALLVSLLASAPLLAGQSAYPLYPSRSDHWPEIERVKVWQSVLHCASGNAVVDSAVTSRDSHHGYSPDDPIYCVPFRNCLSDFDLLQRDMQLVIKDKAAIRYLDSFATKDGEGWDYLPNWDLQKSHQPVKSAEEADELIVRGKNKTRVWDASMSGEIAFGAGFQLFAKTHAFFKDRPTDAQAPERTGSRAAVYREGNGLRVSLYNYYPFREIANWYFGDCH